MPGSLVDAFAHLGDLNEQMAAVLKVVTISPD
jgi:hypothetical protein